ncbi:Xylulose kinase [Klebsiella quasipneumoniae]|nr:Xylulose kinase [Klebsiella quasipneumoniae]
MDFYLGIDIGTSRVKAVLFDQHFTARASAAENTSPRLSANGYAEQDMTQLWHSVLAILRQIARHPALQEGRLRAIGLAGQGEGSGSAMRRANRWGRGSCGAIPAATS